MSLKSCAGLRKLAKDKAETTNGLLVYYQSEKNEQLGVNLENTKRIGLSFTNKPKAEDISILKNKG